MIRLLVELVRHKKNYPANRLAFSASRITALIGRSYFPDFDPEEPEEPDLEDDEPEEEPDAPPELFEVVDLLAPVLAEDDEEDDPDFEDPEDPFELSFLVAIVNLTFRLSLFR